MTLEEYEQFVHNEEIKQQ